MLPGQDRRQTRALFFRAWRRRRENRPLEGVEPLIVAVALRHPEYHTLLENPARAGDRDYPPETANPFLHLGMHIAIEEQLALDQPRGIRAHYRRLLARLTDEHAVQHLIYGVSGRMAPARRARGRPAPESAYLDCLARRAGVSDSPDRHPRSAAATVKLSPDFRVYRNADGIDTIPKATGVIGKAADHEPPA